MVVRPRLTRCSIAPSIRRFVGSKTANPTQQYRLSDSEPTRDVPRVEEWLVKRPYYFNPHTNSLHVPSLHEQGVDGRPMPLNIELNYYAPLKIRPTHHQVVCELMLHSHIDESIDFFADFALRAAFYLNMPAQGTIPLPTRTERWTVAKSPFVHSKSKANYERVTHKRLIRILDSHLDTVETWLGFLRKYEMAGVAFKAHVYNYEAIDLDEEVPPLEKQLLEAELQKK